MQPTKLYILGGSGSGKSTLAEKISLTHNLPHIKLDDIVWQNIQQHKLRDAHDRDQRFAEQVNQDRWILDGIFWDPWIRPGLEAADQIIVLDIPEFTRHYRVIKRHFTLLAENPMRDFKYFFPTLTPLLKLNRSYQKDALVKTMKLLSEYKEKVIVFTSNNQAEEHLSI